MNASVEPQFAALNEQKITSPASPWPRYLAVLLIVQLLLAMGIYAYQRNAQPQIEAQPLLGFALEDADKLIISDANQQVTLQKNNGSWQLPELQQLPVDATKLNSLLDKIKGTKLTWPMTNTASSHERFEVADDKFQRRVQIIQGDKTQAEILLGSSPGFKKVHLRRAGEEPVYAVELSSFEFATSSKDWLDKNLLAAKEPTKIQGPDYVLQKEGDAWRFANEAENSVDTNKAKALVDAMANLMVQEPASSTPSGDTVSIKLSDTQGDWQYDFVKAGDDYFVKRSDRDSFFKISQYDYERIAGVGKSGLTAAAQAQTGSSETPPSNP